MCACCPLLHSLKPPRIWICHLCTFFSCRPRLLFHHHVGSPSLGKTSPTLSPSLMLQTLWHPLAGPFQFISHPPWDKSPKAGCCTPPADLSVQISSSICWPPSSWHSDHEICCELSAIRSHSSLILLLSPTIAPRPSTAAVTSQLEVILSHMHNFLMSPCWTS